MRVVVVGAGLSGLTAAARLADDHEAVVLERNETIGGRLGTVDIGAARFDAGAQFFTVRGDDLHAQVDAWLTRGVAFEWCRGFAGREDGYPRYAGAGGMSALAHDLARGLDVRTGHMVFTLRRLEDGWSVVLDDGSTLDCDALVLTCPVAQAWTLLAESDVEIPDELARSEFHRTIALLVTLDAPSGVPDPGAIQLDPADPDNTFGFVADNQRKGVSPVPAVTLHAAQPWSREHWRTDDDAIRSMMLGAAGAWIDPAAVVDATVRRWRFAGPANPWPEPYWLDEEHRVVVAGDLFAGPKIEGAFNSGVAAARVVQGFDDGTVDGVVTGGA